MIAYRSVLEIEEDELRELYRRENIKIGLSC